ncbi:hypothetical protein HED52_09255 [Ochrobactrum ciceri]|uniref:Uncharacterized protein n=1 Tax=Brucella ciceri TaxID=391287 RepID=A0ABX1DTL6_9HYPH|nr:hypothetical protein [Brucella ciceri]
MRSKVHSAPVLEKHHFRLVITRISITPRTFFTGALLTSLSSATPLTLRCGAKRSLEGRSFETALRASSG